MSRWASSRSTPGNGTVSGSRTCRSSRPWPRSLARRESRRFTETVARNLPGLLYRCRNDPDWTMEYLSAGTEALTGFAPDELTGESGPTYADLIHDEDRDRVWRAVQKAVEERTIEECNSAAEELFGYAPGELEGESTRKLHVDREHHERFGEISDEQLRRTGNYRGEFEMERKDGTVFPTEHSITYVESDSGEPDRSLSIVRDISDRKRRQEQLERSRQLLRDCARHVTSPPRSGPARWTISASGSPSASSPGSSTGPPTWRPSSTSTARGRASIRTGRSTCTASCRERSRTSPRTPTPRVRGWRCDGPTTDG